MYTALKPAGFFRELRHGDPSGPSLHSDIQDCDHPDKPSIVSYLNNGTTISITGTSARDVLDPNHKVIVQLGIATDGTWQWPTDFPYYVQTYNANVPAEFIVHMRSRAWRPPSLSAEEISRLCKPDSKKPTAR